jgi:radical SAM protein with 4Fe4S-binding SPASM domain
LTTECNLGCKYCYTLKSTDVKKEHHSISFNFAKRALHNFFRDYSSRQIRFYGAGEPTLKFGLMKKIKDYAYNLAGGKLKVEVQTNGYFQKKVAEWIAENVDILWISADGPPDIQDLQRPTKGGKPTSDVVERNISFFAKQKHIQVGIRMTVTPLTIHKQLEVIKYFHELGIKYVNAHPACAPVGGSSNWIFQWEPIDFAKNFLNAHNEAKKIGVFYNSLYIANFDEKTRFACRANVPYPHLTPDGYVSCCDFAQFGSEYDPGPLQQLIYGKYIPGEDKIIYDEEKIHKIRSRCAENLEKGPCKGCKFVYHCAGGCIGQVVNETGDIMGIHERNCKVTKYLAERMPLDNGLYPVLHS